MKQNKYKCEVCGRESFKKIKMGGYILCSKHMHQLHKYGKFLDNNPRTNNDKNDYKIDGDIAIFNLYNQKNEKISEFIIDKEDIEKVKYHKWRISHKHVITGLPSQGTQKDLSWVIKDITQEQIKQGNIVVDHINCNPLDNRKVNLRICEQGDNVLNKSFMSNNTQGFIGVSYKKDRNTYDPEIRIGNIRCHLGATKIKEEAVYARYYAEQIVFKEFANKKEQKRKKEFTKNLSQQTKKEIEIKVICKLKSKNLWQ